MVVSIDKDSSSLYTFRPPSLTLDLAVGHKRGAWYLLFARPYAMADTREVSRLDQPGRRIHNSLVEAGEGAGEGPRFYFNSSAFSGWERNDQSLLDYLLSLDPGQPAILSVVSILDNVGRDVPKEVVVLVPEHRLARWCEQCGRWESMNDVLRFEIVRQGVLPGYLCPVCYQKDWFARRILRNIKAFPNNISYLSYRLCS